MSPAGWAALPPARTTHPHRPPVGTEPAGAEGEGGGRGGSHPSAGSDLGPAVLPALSAGPGFLVPLVPRCPVIGHNSVRPAGTPKVPTAPLGLWALLVWLPVVTLLSCLPHLWKLIQNYMAQTGHKLCVLNIWQLAGDGKDECFKAHEHLEHRRLLLCGTSMAMVAAILRSGLRSMLHLGGRVGKGIYFASQNSKSASCVSCTSEKAGITFLTEVALGKPYCITCNDPMLCQPPAGCDSILVCGQTEPDAAQDEEVLLDGRND